jgi:osmotically-inducible protein OsmY
MKSNEELQKSVQDAIKWEPLLHAAEIGVSVKDGVVTLSGVVDSYAKKLEAESATKNIAGVKVIVEKITIKYNDLGLKTDGDIANEVINAFKWNWQVPEDLVKVAVENGWVTLDGEVEWNYQKEASQAAIKNLIGVQGVTNNIVIKTSKTDKVEKEAIESALLRNWSIDDEDIDVKVVDHKVTLSGVVDSWYQKDEAERIAWNAPGVWNVHNNLVIEFDD